MITRLPHPSIRPSLRRSLAAFVAAVALGIAGAAPIAAAPPGNDDIANPIVVPGIPYTNSQDTTEATTGSSDPDCFGTGPTVWYQFTPSVTAELAATTFGSDYDTTLYLGTPDGSGGVDLIDCNDDAGSLQSAIRFTAEAGTTYLFMVGAFAAGPGGNLVFNLDVAPPLPTIELTIEPRGSFTPYGTATIRGTIACTDVSFREMFASMSQRVGRFTISGIGFDFAEGCPSDPTPWEMTITGETGKFAGGQAQVFLSVLGCGAFDCVEAFAEATVRLRR